VLAYVAYWTGTTNLFIVPARQASKADKINSLVSIPGLLKRLKIRALLFFIYKLNKLICLPIKGLHDINKKFDYSDVLEAK